MSENPSLTTPPRRDFLPVIEHLVTVYKLWYGYRDHFPKKSRYTLGDKMDAVFVEVLELLCIASYESKEKKIPTLERALRGIDVLKFFARVAWELTILDNQKYIELSKGLEEVGRMAGGWKKGLQSKTPPH